MARATKGGPAEQLRLLQQVAQVVNTPDAKKMLLAGLSDVAEAGALHVAGSLLGDQAVEAEAKMAVLRIAGALARANPPAAREAVDKLLPAIKDKALADQLNAAVETTNRPAVDEGTALMHDAKRSEDLKKALARRAPPGFHLACYLDCGADSADGVKGGPALKVGQAAAHFWPESDKAAHFRFGTVWYAGGELLFEAAGLDAKKACQIGFSWWDFDGNGRIQSVFLAPGKGGEFRQAVKATKLPDFKNSQEAPAELSVAVPPNLYADGSLRISFRQNGASNVVVSEVWLWEGGEKEAGDRQPISERPEIGVSPRQPAAGDAPVEIKKGEAEPGRTTKVLIVTGIDYPGHKWRETYPVVLAELYKDKRLLVDVAEDPRVLCSDKLSDYAALIIHFMNWEKPDPGEKARANLKAFVEGGKGMVLTHFACGAFQDGGTPWPEFGKLAGRAWDRKLRGHDPYGKFQVRMTDVKHPIIGGMEPFELTDELYTCLAGETPITVLAVSTSKVDQKDYPIAFVLEPGKGRTFHCVLGHDAQAWRTAGPAELLRRGTAWAAGLPPVADRK
jgi:type 1 glutamine amidotransferase